MDVLKDYNNRRILAETKRLQIIPPGKYGRKIALENLEEVREIFHKHGFTNIRDEDILKHCTKLFRSVWGSIAVCLYHEVEILWKLGSYETHLFSLARRVYTPDFKQTYHGKRE